MASLNKVLLIGNLTKDPVVKTTPGGTAVADLRLASTRKFKTPTGETKDETCYVNVTAWGRTAETCREYLSKGSSILVEGRLKYDEWEKEGQKHNRLSIVAERVQFMGAPKNRAVAGDAPDAEPGEAPGAHEEPPREKSVGDDDDLPF